MPLITRLCYVVPAAGDADDGECSMFYSAKPSIGKRPRRRNHRHGISARASAVLRWFCSRGRRCLCFRDYDREADTDSLYFEDIAGVHSLPIISKAVSGSSPRIFSYSEIYIGTNGFSDKEVLGSGGFGRVYRAVLPSERTVVAVKCVARRGDRFEKAFAAELAAVAQLRHRNLVRLRGWCVHDDQLLLVYDYMPNQSLDRFLYPPFAAGGQPLDWACRRRIVQGLAEALFYLHDQLDTQIIHRDVKTSNVMLDSEFNARLGDFGLARWLDHGDEVPETLIRSFSRTNYQFRLSETSRVGGTIGYIPPESFQKPRSSAAMAKSDVFSFGIVVLEVATGRRAVNLSSPDDQIFLLDWVRRLADEGRCLDAMDQRLPDGTFSLSEVRRLIHLGLLCSLYDPHARPTMKWVMETLLSESNSADDLPSLPSFRSQPGYISFSPSTTMTSNALTATSNFLTARNSTLFLTADDDGGDSRRQAGKKMPIVDTPHEIPYEEIKAITNNFSESQMVAEMDFGTGYRGYLDNRFPVLVKRLGMRTCPALRARFAGELHNLARLRHRHLVQLRGWCTEQGEMLVVYDYSTPSLLSHHLFHLRTAALPWRHRYHIIKCLASAVLYLHEEWEEQVIHRNITSSAVFLDPEMNPRLGAFALAEFLSRNAHGHCSGAPATAARGIFGYMSPEYVETGEATTMADVYSFGMVVLEVVSGQMAVDFRRPEVLLVKKVWGLEARKRPLEELADGKLDGEFDREELTRLVKLGIACTRSNPKRRPRMRQIVSILDGNDGLLTELRHKKEGRGDWEGKNAATLSMARRIQALGVQ
ncbi:receptor like protein kinase S.2-like [Curcuma longa]|uniref:receptor like protein kinase S.2-like n=1 Tax=Curcuma longa TaxID=136217 RepID=UPI003D9F715B